MNAWRCLAILAALALSGAARLHADVVSDFETNSDGWTKKPGGDSGTALSRVSDGSWALEMWDAAVGNADYFLAPEKFLGDWTGQGAFALSFDYRATTGSPGLSLDVFVESGGGDVWRHSWRSCSLAANLWTSFYVDLSEPLWTHLGAGSKSWPDSLAQVTALYLDGEVIFGVERNRLDNFRLITDGPAQLAADFDGDDAVDAQDLTRWLAGFGLTSGDVRSQGDANGDCHVDGADLVVWQRQLGLGNVASLASAPVSEPGFGGGAASAMVLVLGTRFPRPARRHADRWAAGKTEAIAARQ